MTELFTFCLMGGTTLIVRSNNPREAAGLTAAIAVTCMCCFINRKLWSK